MWQSGTSVVLPAHRPVETTMRGSSDLAFPIGSLNYQPFLADVTSGGCNKALGAEQERGGLPGGGSSFSQSVIDSTDDGIMTPTLDDSQSESSTHQVVLPPSENKSQGVLTNPKVVMNPNTHNTAFTDAQVSTIEVFAADLQTAIDGAWPIRSKPQYNTVRVLMLAWDDEEPGVWTEADRLRYVFTTLYRFDVEVFRISISSSEHLLRNKLEKFIGENNRGHNLSIVYNARSTLPGVDSMLYGRAKSDVLFLCDHCYSPSLTNDSPPSTTEVLAACGTDHESPSRGPHSFTNVLIRELEKAFVGPPISVIELHGRILNAMENLKPEVLQDPHGNLVTDEYGRPRYQKLEKRSPVHAFITNCIHKRSILLSPLPARYAAGMAPGADRTYIKDESDIWGFSSKRSRSSQHTQFKTTLSATTRMSLSGEPAEASTKHPRVLLSVRFERDYFPDAGSNEDNVWAWAEWLRDIPSGPEPVAIEAVYRSASSTLLLLSLPLLVWHMLPSEPAYSFVGYVDSANLQEVLRNPSKRVAPSRDLGLTSSETKQQVLDIQPVESDMEKEVRRRVEAEMATRELASLRKEKEEWQETMAKLAMSNSFSNKGQGIVEVGKPKAPIRFKDAVGRKYSFPFHLAATWNGVEELIKQAFLHVDVLGPHVNEGHYDLICSSGDLSGQIILPQVWETMVEPGWEVSMHMWPLPEPPKPRPPPPLTYPIPPRGPRLGGPPPPPPPPPAPKVNNRPPPPPPPGYSGPWPSSGSGKGKEVPAPPPPPGHPPSPRLSSFSDSENGSEREDVETENAIALLKSMVFAKRIFVVGKVGTMGYGRRGLIEVSVKPKGEGMQLLNEYGKMFVEKVRALKADKENTLKTQDEVKELLLDD